MSKEAERDLVALHAKVGAALIAMEMSPGADLVASVTHLFRNAKELVKEADSLRADLATARKERDEARAEIGSLADSLDKCMKERDEARASDKESIEMYRRARDDRDAARTEAARLREALEDIEQLWQDRGLSDAGLIAAIMQRTTAGLAALAGTPGTADDRARAMLDAVEAARNVAGFDLMRGDFKRLREALARLDAALVTDPNGKPIGR